jgi:hypothetical protein
VDPASPHNFELHNLDYTREEDVTTYTKKGEYKLFEDGYVDLPTQVEAEDVTVGFERAVTGEHVKFKRSGRQVGERPLKPKNHYVQGSSLILTC